MKELKRDSKGRFVKVSEPGRHFKMRKDLSITVCGIALFRIEATRDIERLNVKKGELGGYIQKEENLSGDAWVYGNARVCGDAKVYGNAWVCGIAQVSGNARVYGNARVCGIAQVYGNARVYGNAQVCGDSLNRREDCSNITGQTYNITILPDSMQIGCQFHTKKEWFGFSDREIIAMDGKNGLKWWNQWKPILESICEIMA